MREQEESEKRLRYLVEKMGEGVIVADGNETITFANDKMCEILGCESNELIGRTIYEFLNETNKAILRKKTINRMKGQSEKYELQFIPKSGDLVSTILSAAPLYDDDDSYVGSFAVVMDVTERKRAEETLMVSEKRYRSLFENMLEGFAYCKMLFDHDKPEDFIYIDVNDAFKELTGLKNVVGKKVSEVIPGIKESNPELFEIYGRVVLTGKPEKFETYLESLGIWLSIAVYSPGKEYFVAVFDNITERKRAEETLKKLSSAVEQTADNIFITNRDGIIEYVNPAFEKLTGYTKEEALGKTPRILKSGKQDQKYYEALWETILSGRVFRAEFVNKKKNGELYYEEKTITPIVDANGSITHFVSTGKDITERKKLEKQQRELELELLHNHKLSAIGQLTAGIVHNLNNPLATIQLAAEVMRKERETKEIEAILSECKRMKEIVSTILRKGRQETETEKRLFDLNEMARIELGFLEADPRFKHRIEKEYHFCDSPALMEGIYSDFSQSFNNIVRNAIDAMHASQAKKLTVATQMDESWIYIIVKDTGCGISEENIPKLFEPFFTSKPRLGEQKGDEPTGTGLGLSSMHQLLSPYGAKFQIRSEVGKGTEFVIKLPRTLQSGAVPRK